jgi:hypothetical protein
MTGSKLALAALAAATVATLCGAGAAAENETPLGADLAGASVRPGPADADGAGSARIVFGAGERNVCFEIAVSAIAPATMAHIHRGAPDEAGGPPLIILAAPVDGASSGCVAAPAQIVAEVRADPAAYFVTIHNAEFPGGAVRGQLHR